MLYASRTPRDVAGFACLESAASTGSLAIWMPWPFSTLIAW